MVDEANDGTVQAPTPEPPSRAITPPAERAPGGPRERGRSTERPAWMIPAAAAAAILLVVMMAWWLIVVMPRQRQVDEATGFYGQGRYAEASATLDAVLETDPNHRNALLALAKVKAATGDTAGALDLYQRVIDSGGAYSDVLYDMAILERVVGRTKTAADHFRLAWERDRSEVRYAEELARTLVQLGDMKQAAEAYLEIADDTGLEDAKRAEYYVKAALVFIEGQDMAGAKTALGKAAELDPKNAQVKMLEARIKGSR